MDQKKIDWLLNNANLETKRSLTEMLSNINCFVNENLGSNPQGQPEAPPQNDRYISNSEITPIGENANQSNIHSAFIPDNMLFVNKPFAVPKSQSKNYRDAFLNSSSLKPIVPKNLMSMHQSYGSSSVFECLYWPESAPIGESTIESNTYSAQFQDDMLFINNSKNQYLDLDKPYAVPKAQSENDRDAFLNSSSLKPIVPKNLFSMHQLYGSSSVSECLHWPESAPIGEDAIQSNINSAQFQDDVLFINNQTNQYLHLDKERVDFTRQTKSIYEAQSNVREPSKEEHDNLQAEFVAYEAVEVEEHLEDGHDCYESFNKFNSIFDELRTAVEPSSTLGSKTFNQQSSSNQLDKSNELETISLNISTKLQEGSSDNALMLVQTSDRPKKEKKLCCLYCYKSTAKLARHLQTHHKDEADVTKLLDLPKGSQERRKILDTLRKKGTLIWNTNSKINNGELIVSRRPNPKFNKKATDYSTCPKCLGSFSISNVRNHVRDCTNNALKGQRVGRALGRAIEARIHERASDLLRIVIFPILKDDEVVRLIRFDWLVIVYANQLCIKYSAPYQHKMIRSRIRDAGNLLLALKNINPEVTDFASMYQPKFYDSMIKAIRVVGKLYPILNEFGSPSTAAAAVTQVKQIGLMLIAEYIKIDEPVKQKQTDNFLTLVRADIGISINKTVADTQAKMRRKKKERIPSTDDIKKLATYLDNERNICFGQLHEEYTDENWVKLSELTIASIIVFNRRRTGEAQNIEVTDFIGRERIDEQSNGQLFTTLTEQAKQIVKEYNRMKIRGKKGRTVSVLLKPAIVECIQLLLDHRHEAGITDENYFLFALPTCSIKRIKVVDAGNVLKKASVLCGARDPLSLRGTNMRKHVASMCITMDLNDNSVGQLAEFMGHHVDVHRDRYRINPLENEIVKISQLLEAAQGNGDDSDDSDEENDIVAGITENTIVEDIVNDKTSNANMEYENPTSFVDNSVTLESTNKYVGYSLPNPSKLVQKRKSSSAESRVDQFEEVTNKKFKKKRWDEDEIAGVYRIFPSYFRTKSLPSAAEIIKQQSLHKCLQRRTPEQIKTWIHNQFKNNAMTLKGRKK